jgi:hypothetical protein
MTAAAGIAGAVAPRVLACYWGLDRATDVTFLGFKKFVLDVLNADLCAAVTDKNRDGSGAWRNSAKYLDVYEEPQSYEPFVSSRAQALALNSSLERVLHNNFLHPTGIQQMYSKARIWRLIEQHGLLEEYDWFLVCRTDLFWLAPHVDFRGDETRSVWVPYAGRKSDRQGYYDRAVVVHKSRVQHVLTLMDTVSAESHPFMDALRGYPGSVGRSTNCESFYRQYLEFANLPIKRFDFTAFVTATNASIASQHAAHLNQDMGHLYRYTDEYVVALNNAMQYFSALHQLPSTAALLPSAHSKHNTRDRRFFVITIEHAERVNRTLANCALSAWGMAVYERLLSHPLRTLHVAEAYAAFAPPHGAWDFHWPVFNGNRERNLARPDAHFPLPKEQAGYEPYGSSLATSCRTFFSPCGYEGCVPEFGARRLGELLDAGEVLSSEGLLAVLEALYKSLNFVPGHQYLVFYDSGAAGPVAYTNQTHSGGYDLPARAYTDKRFIFALASSLEDRFRLGHDVSLPTPWTEDVRRYGVRTSMNRSFFLTFKGDLSTSRLAGNVRQRVMKALHDPLNGIVIVDAATVEGARYEFQQLMYDTVFALIMRGDQPYSYRYTQAVCSGAVPVMVVSDGWVPPFSTLHSFSEYGILVHLADLPHLISQLRALPLAEVERLRYAAKQFCMQHLITVHQQTDSMIDIVLSRP